MEYKKIRIMKLGDLIELITTYTGIKWVVKKISKLTGKPCGCDKRKEQLNDIELWQQKIKKFGLTSKRMQSVN